MKFSILASALIAVTVALTACLGSVLPQGFDIVVRLLGLRTPYMIVSPVTKVKDQSDSSTVKAEVKTSANFEPSPQQKERAQVVFNAAGPKSKPILKNGSYVLNLTFQIDATTGVGSASGTGRFMFKGKRGGQWCVDFTTTITDFGSSIQGNFHTTGGTGTVGAYSVKSGKIDATISSDSVMHLTLSGNAKPQQKQKKMPKSCKELSV